MDQENRHGNSLRRAGYYYNFHNYEDPSLRHCSAQCPACALRPLGGSHGVSADWSAGQANNGLIDGLTGGVADGPGNGVGHAYGHLKNDQKTKDLLKQKIAENAFVNAGTSLQEAQQRYANYANRLAATLSQFTEDEQKDIFNGPESS